MAEGAWASPGSPGVPAQPAADLGAAPLPRDPFQSPQQGQGGTAETQLSPTKPASLSHAPSSNTRFTQPLAGRDLLAGILCPQGEPTGPAEPRISGWVAGASQCKVIPWLSDSAFLSPLHPCRPHPCPEGRAALMGAGARVGGRKRAGDIPRVISPSGQLLAPRPPA